jgi:hypothetical protein
MAADGEPDGEDDFMTESGGVQVALPENRNGLEFEDMLVKVPPIRGNVDAKMSRRE